MLKHLEKKTKYSKIIKNLNKKHLFNKVHYLTHLFF